MEAFLALIIGLLIGLIAGIFISSITVNNLMLTIIAIVAGYVCVELAWKQIFNYFGF